MRLSRRRQLHKYLLMILAVLLCLLFPTVTTMTFNKEKNPSPASDASGTDAVSTDAVSTSAPVSTEVTAPAYQSTSVYSNKVFAALVNELLTSGTVSESAPLETFQIISRDASGCVTALQIAGESIDIEVFTEQFDLNSTYFEVDEYNGGIRIITK